MRKVWEHFLAWLVGKGTNDEVAAEAVAATSQIIVESRKLDHALRRARERDPFNAILGDYHRSGKK